MASTTIDANTTRSDLLDMSGTDDLTVVATGKISVGTMGVAVRFNSATTGGLITNNGLIEYSAAGGRAIRFTNNIGANLTATIHNDTANSTIQAPDDAIQIQAGAVTGGKVTLTNAGMIQSTGGNQAIDFAGATSNFIADITNSGTIRANADDAIRIGSAAVANLITNTGTINGGSDAAYGGNVDGIQFEANAKGSVTNSTASGAISGDRHGINASGNSVISVTNNAGATITGRNGSGVGSDGSATVINFGTITGAFSNSAGSDINGPGGPGADGNNDGDGDGIDVDGEATITNDGIIEGTGAGGHGSDGLPNTSEGIAAGGGTFTNHSTGIIRGLGLGILIDDSSQGNTNILTNVINDGTITGTNSFGIKIVSLLADTITNNGTISGGGGTAILFGGGDNTLKLGATSVITGLSDGGAGANTLDYSTFGAGGVTVNLGAGTASGTSGITRFQQVIGSTGIDTLTGDANANRFTGGGGDDTVNGGGGSDTAVYSGTRANYNIVRLSTGEVSVSDTRGGNPDGFDKVTNVEQFRFSDGDKSLAQVIDITDFNVFWHQTSTNDWRDWTLSGGAVTANLDFASFPEWDLKATGDFNADGIGDSLWRNTTTGQVRTIEHSSSGVISVNVITTLATGWAPIGTGDFNGDATSDVIWENANTGELRNWSMQDGVIANNTSLGVLPAEWQLVATGDFNGDGTHDMFFRSTATGAMREWLMSNGALASNLIFTGPTSNWAIAATGDFNHDNTTDIIWRDSATGEARLWLMANGAVANNIIMQSPLPQWKLIAVGDYDQNGHDDLLWQNSSTGDVREWLMTNGTLNSSVVIAGGAPIDFTTAVNASTHTDFLPSI